jgi:hypothetical protein
MSVRSLATTLASTASASSPRLSDDKTYARMKLDSGPPPARTAASASRSASARSRSQTASGGADKQARVGLEVGVETQGGTTHHNSHVVSIFGRGKFGGDQSTQPPNPGGRRALPANLAIKRVRHPHFHASVDLVQVDETAGLGFLDSFGISDPAQRLQADRLTDCQDIHHIADRLGEYSRWVLPSLPKSRIGELIADTVSAVVVSSACGCGATGDDGACAGGEPEHPANARTHAMMRTTACTATAPGRTAEGVASVPGRRCRRTCSSETTRSRCRSRWPTSVATA